MKTDLAAGMLPSKYFGANAAWLQLAVIAYNVLNALKLGLAGTLIDGPKRLCFLIFHMPDRLVHHARQLSLRLGDSHLRNCLCSWTPFDYYCFLLRGSPTGSYLRICRALLGSASEKNRPSTSRCISQTHTLCSTTKGSSPARAAN